MNVFINFIKRSLVKKRTRDEAKALGEVQALGGIKIMLLLVLKLFTIP